MNNLPLRRLMFASGVAIAALGMYAGSRTSTKIEWNSYVSMVIIGVGAFVALVGLMGWLGEGESPGRPKPVDEVVLPARMIPLVFGGFITLIALVAGLAVGHWAGRNQGFLTFIFAFVVANLVFGLGLALGRAPTYR
jgi:hypothetical protein